MNNGISITDLALAIGVAFILGSLPTAYVVSRLRGVNIFEVGTRQAGATNVYREVGARYGVAVLAIDAGKGAAAVLLATAWIGVTGSWLLLPAIAAILGHWNSPFTRFRGGDGVATGLGVLLAIAPVALIAPLAVGLAVALAVSSSSAHPSLWGGLAAYATLLGTSLLGMAGVSSLTTLGITAILAMILLHSLVYHRRRRGTLPVRGRPIERDLLDAADSQLPRTMEP